MGRTMAKKSTTKAYLGDAVYADYEFGQIILTTEDGAPETTNRIVLESEVYAALEKFVTDVRKQEARRREVE